MPGLRRGGPAVGLLLLAPICAEYLAAYDASTGHPLELAGGLLILAPLYGAPALLIRELARRRGAGWPGMLWFAAALGLLQAGAIDQSLFSETYRGLEGWASWRQATLVPGLGVSLHMVAAFVGGHVVFSFGAPIAVVEALAGERRTTPWLGPVGLAVAFLAYVAAAALVLADHLQTEASHASAAQLTATLVAAAAMAAWGVRPRRRAQLDSSRRALTPAWLAAGAFGVETLVAIGSETWLLTLVGLAARSGGIWLVGRQARALGWSPRHVVALAAGALLSRAGLAFAYFPLTGTVAAGPKYAHNVAMLALVLVVSGLAARATSRS
jgi:hypothetical protein